MSYVESDFNIDELTEEQQDIIDCIGFDNYCKLIERFGGSSIYLSKSKSIDKQKRNERIIKEFRAGNSYKCIALKYGLTEVWVRNIIAGKN